MAALVILLKGFARTSETFITRELQALEARGFEPAYVSLRVPEAGRAQPHSALKGQVLYLPEYLHRAPLRVWRAFRALRLTPHYQAAKALFLKDFQRDFSRNRVRRFGQALVLAHELGPDARHLHAHFIHTPTSVARYAASLRGLSFSVSAHAKDIFTSPDWELREKIEGARFVCVCHERGLERLWYAAGPQLETRLRLVPHGIALPPALARNADALKGEALTLLTVARAVPKKGLDTILEALALLPAEIEWRWRHVGGGEDLKALRRAAARHRFAGRLEILGPLAHEDTLNIYLDADLFVMAPREGGDGDRDGRPNALLEAMGAGLLCVTTDGGSVREVMSDQKHGLITPPDAQGLASGLLRGLTEPGLRLTLGQAARGRALKLAQEGAQGYDTIAALLRAALEPKP